MLRLLHLRLSIVTLTVTLTTAENSDVSDLLQRRTGAAMNYSSPEALKELADVLVLAKKECLASSVDCIGTLKQVWDFFGLAGEWFGKGMMRRIWRTKEYMAMSFC